MPYIKDLALCQFYACKNPQHDGAVVTVQIPDEESPVEILSCLYHQAILTRGSDKYSVGRTFRGDVELRPISAQFAESPIPTEPEE